MDETLIQIGANIWLYPADDDRASAQPNIGIVVAPSGTVLVDAGNSPRAARRIRQALDQLPAPPVVYIIYTHHHWEHVLGAQTFQAPAAAHALCGDLLTESAKHPWTPAVLDEEIRRNPALAPAYEPMLRAVDDWQTLRVIPPRLTFTHDLTLHVTETALRLEHVGGQHASDSIIVRIPGSGITFIGDCLERPLANPASTALDRALIAHLLADETAQLFVDGHTRAPHPRADIAALLDGGEMTIG